MSRGTTPPGVHDEREAARWVRDMFGRVAGRYDLLNHLLSFQIDRRWRATTVKRMQPVLDLPGARVVDLCCGTGDLLLELQRRNRGTIYGTDFSHPMLLRAAQKIAARQADARLFEADALRLPLCDGSADLLTAAFGFRNLVNYRAGLGEMLRVLKQGGTAAILEFSTPPNRAFAALYSFYSRRILPAVGGAISGSREAYTYLPDSVRKFPAAEELAAEMRQAGFADVRFERMTGGIVTLHTGVKP